MRQGQHADEDAEDEHTPETKREGEAGIVVVASPREGAAAARDKDMGRFPGWRKSTLGCCSCEAEPARKLRDPNI